jgi:hypothetical protein
MIGKTVPRRNAMSLEASDSFLARTVQAFLAHLRSWSARRELDNFDRQEIERIAAELGMTAADLRDLAACGPDAAELLTKWMTALGISRDDVERTALGLMRDLERTCSCCGHKKQCAADLADRPDDPVWKDYCPNALALDGAAGMKRVSQSNKRTMGGIDLQDDPGSPERRTPD